MPCTRFHECDCPPGGHCPALFYTPLASNPEQGMLWRCERVEHGTRDHRARELRWDGPCSPGGRPTYVDRDG